MPINDLSEAQKTRLKTMNLDPVLQGILNNATVSPEIQFNIFTQVAGTNCDFFTETFTTKDDLSARAPEQFGYNIPDGKDEAATGHNKSEGEDETTRLRIAWSNSQTVAHRNTTMQNAQQGGDKSQYGIADGDRILLSRTYQKHNNDIPLDIDDQGSDGHLGKTHRHMSQGRIYACTSDDTLGWGEQYQKKPKRITGADGQLIETYDEQGYRPTD